MSDDPMAKAVADEFGIEEPLLMAVQPNEEITEDDKDNHWICRQMTDKDGKVWCWGYHCPYCGAPTSMYGHVTGSGDETRITCQEEADEQALS